MQRSVAARLRSLRLSRPHVGGQFTPKLGASQAQISRDVVLVGHSGAGALLPAIGAFSPRPVAGYLFVDAGLLIRAEADLTRSRKPFPIWPLPWRQASHFLSGQSRTCETRSRTKPFAWASWLT